MFKSSQHLREAAAQRQLDRVASSWRQARTTWFDGTPESIEARLAETNRLLTVARSGQTPAHIGLSVEAENARKELLAAKHRLLNDFLDDGARAFKGSKRVAGQPIVDLFSHGGDTGSSATLRHRDDKENNRYVIKGIPDAPLDGPRRAIVNHDDTELMSADGMHHWASRRTADESTGFGMVNPAGQAEMAARAESELDPEMYGNYYDGPSSDDCRHCGEKIEERGDGSYGHVLGQNPYTGDTTFYPSDHPAQPDDDYHTAAVLPDFDNQLLFDSH